jgi:curved DNA-binding protein CbpA
LKDYYKILGLERTASGADIKKAYLKLIRLYHPDLQGNKPNATEKFQEIAEAYRVLGNLDNRLQYSLQLNKKVKIPKYIYSDNKNTIK